MKKIQEAKCIRTYGPYRIKNQIVWYVYDKDNIKHIAHNEEEKIEIYNQLTN
jgi:uncharacterized membrane protein YvbJ